MICQKNKCTGCFACYNACPKNAIKLIENDFGFIYPTIDRKKCINCNLCKKVCPQLIDTKIERAKPQKTYAVYSNDIEIREKSTSGGAATSISKSFIENNGVVYGASNLFNNEEFNFKKIDNIKDLYKIQGSKYIHCYIKDSYKLIKKDLLSGNKVLFIGTPCQVAGLKSFLISNYENLYTVDIICHGVPSQRMLFEDLKLYKIEKKDFEIIRFRDKKGFNLSIYKNYEDLEDNKPIKSVYANLDYFYKNFLRGNIYRDNCYECKYANDKRVADVTLGDFWGLDNNSKAYDNEKMGISVFLCNTSKGKELFNLIKENITYDERKLEEAKKNNEQLNKPMKKNKQYVLFKKYYNQKGFLYTMKKMNLLKDYLKYNFVYLLLKKIKYRKD